MADAIQSIDKKAPSIEDLVSREKIKKRVIGTLSIFFLLFFACKTIILYNNNSFEITDNIVQKTTALTKSHSYSLAKPILEEDQKTLSRYINEFVQYPFIEQVTINNPYNKAIISEGIKEDSSLKNLIEPIEFTIFSNENNVMKPIGSIVTTISSTYIEAQRRAFLKKEIITNLMIFVLIIASVAIILHFIVGHFIKLIDIIQSNAQQSIPKVASHSIHHESKDISKLLNQLKNPKQGSFSNDELIYIGKSIEWEIERRTEALRLAKQEAENANNTKSEFLANISHELRTPMHSILGFSEIGLETIGQGSIESQKENFQSIYNNGKQLLHLLDNLLDLAKMEKEEVSFIKTEHDILEIIEHVGNDLKSLFKNKNLTLKVENSAKNLLAYCDDKKIAQVIRNLLGNAIKFSPENGTITIKLNNVVLSEEDILFHNSKIGFSLLKDDLFFLVHTQLPVINGITRAKAAGGIDPYDNSSIDMLYNWIANIYQEFLISQTNYSSLRFVNIEDMENAMVISKNGDSYADVENTTEWFSTESYNKFLQKAKKAKVDELFFSKSERLDENTQYVSGLMFLCDEETGDVKNIIELGKNERMLPESGVDMLSISVIDEGVGIPEKELEEIFEKFLQSSRTNKGSGGTGLGLAICDKIIKGHHGKIWAENNDDKGTTFSFVLPSSDNS